MVGAWGLKGRESGPDGEIRGRVTFEWGEFSDDRNTVTGRWEWPGGGYEATMTRAE